MTPDRARNRPHSKETSDEWLTPPALVEAASCGRPFDLDPASAARMPWRTALRMLAIDKPGRGPTKTDVKCGVDGLAAEWVGRVWLNPPYSDILPWVDKMRAHGNGFMLVPAKSTDTKWGQAVLASADAILFFAGRIAFCLPDGTQTKAGWGPSMLASWNPAYTCDNVLALAYVADCYQPGTILRR